MKDKKFLKSFFCLSILLIFVLSCTFFAVGCSKNKTPEKENEDIPPQVEYTLSLDRYEISIAEDCEDTLIATSNQAGTISWSSDKKDIATVVGGKILAKQVGTANITATIGNVSKTCKVIVTKGDKSFKSLETAESVYAVEIGGDSIILEFALYNYDGNGEKTKIENAEITYELTNTKIAKIKENKITGLKHGETTITATAGNLRTTAKLKVYDKFISNSAEWKNMIASRKLGEYYMLDDDIDFNGVEYSGMATDAPQENAGISFRAVLDGNGHTVKNAKIVGTSSNYVSLFGHVYGAKISDINFENIVISTNGNASGLATSVSKGSLFENIKLDLKYEKVPAMGYVLFNSINGGEIYSIVATVESPTHNSATIE